MKKLLTLVLALSLIGFLTGCGGEEPEKVAAPPSSNKIPYQKYQVMKKQFKQIKDMFVYDPINDEIVTAMAKPEEFKGERGVQLAANLKTHETELVAAKRFFDKKSDFEKINQYNQNIMQAIDKKTQAFAYALDYLKTLNPQDKGLFVQYNSEAVNLVDQAGKMLTDLEADVE